MNNKISAYIPPYILSSIDLEKQAYIQNEIYVKVFIIILSLYPVKIRIQCNVCYVF